ncbi:MAG: hypothetical protein AAF772_13370 [Acidobacteriota bacterium]
MSLDEAIGAFGVALLLAAFALNLTGRLDRADRRYAALNALGAGIAAYASWRIDYLPFVVLEGTWCAASLVALVRPPAGGRARPPADPLPRA